MTLRTRRRFIVAAAAWLPAALLAGCATGDTAPPPEVALERVTSRGGGLLAQHLAVRLRITNPRDTELTIDGLRARILVNGRKLARGVSDARLTVPRLASRTLTVEATASALDVVRQVFGLRAGDERTPVHFAQGGTLQLGTGRGDADVRLAPRGGR